VLVLVLVLVLFAQGVLILGSQLRAAESARASNAAAGWW